MTANPLRLVRDPGMLTIRFRELFGLQIYWPILKVGRDVFKASFSTCLVASLKTWQFRWSVGFRVLGFGFGVGRYQD